MNAVRRLIPIVPIASIHRFMNSIQRASYRMKGCSKDFRGIYSLIFVILMLNGSRAYDTASF